MGGTDKGLFFFLDLSVAYFFHPHFAFRARRRLPLHPHFASHFGRGGSSAAEALVIVFLSRNFRAQNEGGIIVMRCIGTDASINTEAGGNCIL